ncbi:MAG: hypothetical protein ACYDAO_06015 [Thermoplasmataceae archaeon]
MNSRKIFSGIALLFLAMSVLMVVPGESNAANQTFGATLNYPGTVYSLQNFSFYVNETPGYSNYSAVVYAGAQNVTNMDPITPNQKVSPNNGSFHFLMIAPAFAPQTMYVYVQEFADFHGVQVKNYVEIKINVVQPVVFHAVLSDKLSVPVYNVTVIFLLDSHQVGTKFVNVVNPNSTTNVNLTLPSDLISTGEHTLEITVSNASVFINNKQSFVTNFYVGTPPNYSWIYYISVGAAIFMAFLFFASTRKKKGMSYVPKWRKAKKK